MNRVHNSVQEAVDKVISNKKKWKKAKWLSREALKITEKRKDMKGKGQRERYTQLNAEFQRISRWKEYTEELCKKMFQ